MPNHTTSPADEGRITRRGFLSVGGAAGVVAALALTACSGPGATSTTSSAGGAAAPSAVSTDVAATRPQP